jgi:hypothetical protein
MTTEAPRADFQRPLPVCAVLAVLSLILCIVIPALVAFSDSDNGDFRSLIAMHHALYGGLLGAAFGFVFGIGASLRRERHAFLAALATLVAVPVLLFFSLIAYSTSG